MYDRARGSGRRWSPGRRGGNDRQTERRFAPNFGRTTFNGMRPSEQQRRANYREFDRGFANRSFEKYGRPRNTDIKYRGSHNELNSRGGRPSFRGNASNFSANNQRKRAHSPSPYNRPKVPKVEAPGVGATDNVRADRSFPPGPSDHRRSRLEERYPTANGNQATSREYQAPARLNRPASNHTSNVRRDYRPSPKPDRPPNVDRSVARREYRQSPRPGRSSGSGFPVSHREYQPYQRQNRPSSDRFNAPRASKSVYSPGDRQSFGGSRVRRWK